MSKQRRKKAGLNVDDRIVWIWKPKMKNCLKRFQEFTEKTIAAETLAEFGEVSENSSSVKIDGAELKFLKKR